MGSINVDILLISYSISFKKIENFPGKVSKMENSTTIKSEDFNSLTVGRLVEASVISPILSINSFFWTEVLEGFNMLKKQSEVFEIIDNALEKQNLSAENEKEIHMVQQINNVDIETEASKPIDESISDQEPIYENVSNAVEKSIPNQEPLNQNVDVAAEVPKSVEGQTLDLVPLKEAYGPIDN